MKCCGKEQEILLPNIKVQTRKAYLPSAAAGTHSHAGIQETAGRCKSWWETEAIEKEEKERKLFFPKSHDVQLMNTLPNKYIFVFTKVLPPSQN